MKNFQFIFEGPQPPPNATTPVDEVFAWAVWCAMKQGLNDVVVDETERGLVVGCLDYNSRGKNRGPKYYPLATLPHLRGSPLRNFPAKSFGVATSGDERWDVRIWTCQKLAGEIFRLCAIVQLVPQSAA